MVAGGYANILVSVSVYIAYDDLVGKEPTPLLFVSYNLAFPGATFPRTPQKAPI